MKSSELDLDLEDLAQKRGAPSSADSLLIHWVESQDFSDLMVAMVAIDRALEVVGSNEAEVRTRIIEHQEPLPYLQKFLIGMCDGVDSMFVFF
jgi:hypothetical protein